MGMVARSAFVAGFLGKSAGRHIQAAIPGSKSANERAYRRSAHGTFAVFDFGHDAWRFQSQRVRRCHYVAAAIGALW